jgi:hypothetical protein
MKTRVDEDNKTQIESQAMQHVARNTKNSEESRNTGDAPILDIEHAFEILFQSRRTRLCFLRGWGLRFRAY